MRAQPEAAAPGSCCQSRWPEPGPLSTELPLRLESRRQGSGSVTNWQAGPPEARIRLLDFKFKLAALLRPRRRRQLVCQSLWTGCYPFAATDID